MSENQKGSLLLLLNSFIWGTAFVAQSQGMEHVGPFTFQTIRNILGTLVLLPVILLRSRKETAEQQSEGTSRSAERRRTWIAGLLCGLILAAASNLQQIGIQYTTVGKAGFLTSLYLILVPILGSLLFRQRISKKIGLCVALSLIGIYLLSVTENLTIAPGDILILTCALFFSFHILAIDRLAKGLDGVKISCIQFTVAALLSSIPMVLLERPDMASILSAALPLLYAGVLSSGVAYTLQILGQQRAEPTTATILMSMESVFSLLGGIVILHQIPSGREICGSLLLFAAVLLSQLPVFERRNAVA